MSLLKLLSHRKTIYIFALILIPLGSCEYLTHLSKDGDIIMQERPLFPFQSIVIDAPYHIHLVQSDDSKILLEGLDYLMSDVVIVENKSVLTLSHSQSDYIQKSKRIKVTIFASDFSRIVINKPVDLTSEGDVSGDEIKIVFNGGASFSVMNMDLKYNEVALTTYGLDHVGEYYLNGACDVFRLTIEGLSKVIADGLQSQKSYINHKSINSCKVRCKKQLQVNVYNGGNTYYIGNPEVTTERISIDGLLPSGKVIEIDEYK